MRSTRDPPINLATHIACCVSESYAYSTARNIMNASTTSTANTQYSSSISHNPLPYIYIYVPYTSPTCIIDALNPRPTDQPRHSHRMPRLKLLDICSDSKRFALLKKCLLVVVSIWRWRNRRYASRAIRRELIAAKISDVDVRLHLHFLIDDFCAA